MASEKGLLRAEDFEHLQKVIEVYSKALLYETRKRHMHERRSYYQSEDWHAYVEMLRKQ
jgi:hypothetical protein